MAAFGQDLICRLRISGAIAGSCRRGDAERDSGIVSKEPAQRPTAGDLRQDALLQELFAFSER